MWIPRYAEFVKEPLAVVQQLYKDFGWEYTKEFDTALKNEIESLNTKRAARAKAKAGGSAAGAGSNTSGHMAHTYSMDEYGLDEFPMRTRLSWYYDEYLQDGESKQEKNWEMVDKSD